MRFPDASTLPEHEADRRRLGFALLLSVAFHALLLSLVFGGDGRGLPSLAFPWQERRTQAPELSVRLADPPPVAVPAPALTPPQQPQRPTPPAP
jgi:hypothetical protein